MPIYEFECTKCHHEFEAFLKLDESYENMSPFDLSGGQKRRAAIAGILAMEPGTLILDEPTAGLDPKGRDEILGLDINNLTPVEALNKLNDIKKIVKGK